MLAKRPPLKSVESSNASFIATVYSIPPVQFREIINQVTSPVNGKILRIELSADEALILFDFLARCDDAGSLPVVHQAEQKVLWRVEGQLQESLVEVILPEYAELVRQARDRVASEAPGPN